MLLKESRTGLTCQTNEQTTPKSDMVFGVFLGIMFIVITFNQEFKSTCLKKGLFFAPLKYIDVVRRTPRHWMYCVNVAETIIGTLTVTDSSQIH